MRARRLAAAVALVAVVGAGLVVHTVLPGSAVTDIAGDALYAVAAYTGLVMLFPRAPRGVVAAVAGAWCVGVELLQLTGVPLALAQRVPPLALILGAGFDARDLLVYVSAVGVVLAVDAVVSRRTPSPRGTAPRGVGGSE